MGHRGVLRGWAISYEGGTPVLHRVEPAQQGGGGSRESQIPLQDHQQQHNCASGANPLQGQRHQGIQPLLTKTQSASPAHPCACNTHHQTVSPCAPLLHSPTKQPRDPCSSRDFWSSLLSSLYQVAQFGQFGCHGLDELLISELRGENREVHSGTEKHSLDDTEICWGHGSLCCLMLAQDGEQSAHLRHGFFRLPACLVRAKGSRSACVYNRAWWIL